MFLKAPCKSFSTVNLFHHLAFPNSVFMQNPLYSPPNYSISNIEIVCNVFQYFSSVPFHQPHQSALTTTGHFSRTISSFCIQQASDPLLECLDNVYACISADDIFIRHSLGNVYWYIYQVLSQSWILFSINNVTLFFFILRTTVFWRLPPSIFREYLWHDAVRSLDESSTGSVSAICMPKCAYWFHMV